MNRMESLWFRSGLVALSLLFGSAANAITCGTVGPQTLQATADPASDCVAVAGNDPFPGALSAFGFSWTAVDKSDSADGSHNGALALTGEGTGAGTWAIDPSIYPNPYNQFVLVLKGGNNFVAFLLSALNGTWQTSKDLSHASLYGRLGDEGCCDQQLPEPGSLMLLGLGLLGLGFARRRIGR